MERFRKGDRCIPLPNSPRYGPQRWKLDPDKLPERVWIQQEMTEAEKDMDRMQSALFYANPLCPWSRTEPITEEDIRKYGLPPGSLDGCAITPKVDNIIGKGPDKEASRRAQEAAWESNYAKMESKQETIKLEAKPEVNILEEIAKKKIALERGD